MADGHATTGNVGFGDMQPMGRDGFPGYGSAGRRVEGYGGIGGIAPNVPQVGQGQPDYTEGSVRERVDSLAREVSGLQKVFVALESALHPVLRPVILVPNQGERIPLPPGYQTTALPPRRTPQCDVAVRVEGTENVVRDIVVRLNDLISRLEV